MDQPTSFGRRASSSGLQPSRPATRTAVLPSARDLMPEAWTGSTAEVSAWNRERMGPPVPWRFRLMLVAIILAGLIAKLTLPFGDWIFGLCLVGALGALASRRKAGAR